ncbi:MAG TPA: hypothetical protein ENK10_05090, partial [Acidobacteria bacterium]|nr:hypothetical protein [Acidobacteriota bacterium]
MSVAQATTGHNRRRPGLPRSTAPNRGVVAAGRAFPRLRRDLVLIPQEGAGAGVVVQDPRAQRFFRFGDTERFLLSRLTGQSSVEQIRQDVCLWSGEQWECEEIESFLLDLERAGLLESGAGAPGSPEIAARGGVLGVLARKGLRFRSSDTAETVDDPSVEGRAADREREHFARAVRAIARGQGGEARQALDRVLVLNPANRRAAALRTLLDRRPGVSAAEEPAERPAVAPAPASGSGASRRPLNPFYLRYRLGDPDKMLAALARPLGFVWTRGFALVYLALLAVAGWIGLTHHAEILGSVPVLDPGLWVLLLVAAAVGLTVFHEAAHGLAARHLGVPVREVGVMLIFFVMPAVYVDVSGAWLLRRRSQRLLVTIAGPLFDLGATALALLAWRVLPPGPLQATVLLIGGVSALSLLMNLNPLIRLDGYWALSDVSGIPNLRAVAVGELRQTLGGLFG